jgi:ryanodine receptor 2
MVSAEELYNQVNQDATGKGTQGMFIGCFIDTATGVIRFECEGKQTKFAFKVLTAKH